MATPQQRQRSAQTQTTEERYIHVDHSRETVGFSHGVMMVNGVLQRPKRVLQFESTNGLTVYTAVAWEDPTAEGTLRVSCNCPGWTRSTARDCKHAIEIRTGQASGARRVSDQRIATRQEAVEYAHLPDGKELRAIEF